MLIYSNYIIISMLLNPQVEIQFLIVIKYLNYFFLIKDNLFNNLIFIFFFHKIITFI